jgi:hypothetical protein
MMNCFQILLSNFAFKFNLRRYIKGVTSKMEEREKEAASLRCRLPLLAARAAAARRARRAAFLDAHAVRPGR